MPEPRWRYVVVGACALVLLLVPVLYGPRRAWRRIGQGAWTAGRLFEFQQAQGIGPADGGGYGPPWDALEPPAGVWWAPVWRPWPHWARSVETARTHAQCDALAAAGVVPDSVAPLEEEGGDPAAPRFWVLTFTVEGAEAPCWSTLLAIQLPVVLAGAGLCAFWAMRARRWRAWDRSAVAP